MRYIDKAVPLLGRSIESYMGNVVHETLEWLYDTSINHDLATKQEVIDYYNRRWVSRWKDDIRVIKNGFDSEHYKDEGRDCVEKYYDRYTPFNQSVVIGLEKRIYMDLPGGKKIMGIIDRLDKKSKTHLEVHDYKTSGRLIEQSQADVDRQLSLYALGIHQNFPEVETVDLIWHFVKFDEEIRSQRDKSRLEKLAIETSSKIDMIESAVKRDDLPPSRSVLCDWCEYKKQCPEFSKIIDNTEIRDVVDKYASLSQNEDIPKADKSVILRTIGDKIKLFSQQTGHRTVKGMTHKAIVEDVFQRIPPSEEDLRWYGLKEALKNMDLVTEDLEGLFSHPELSDEQKNSLKEYFDIERSTKVVIEEL